MKWNKKQVGLVAGVVCVILLLVLMLTMCTGEKETVAPVTTTEAPETTQPVTEVVEKSEATEETTEATEETTEATEETTEATQPTYNNSVSGGTTETQPTETVEIPDAGSEGSPYYEMVGEVAQAEPFDTVSIPENNGVYYNLDMAEAAILTIEDADAYVIYQDKKYEADENGIVALTLAAARDDAPVLVQIGNKAAEKAFTLKFSHAPGAEQNPTILEDGETVTDGMWTRKLDTALAAENAKGYFYQYTAAEKGTLTAALDASEGVEIVITKGETVSKSIDGMVSMEMEAGDVAMIQVVAVPGEDGAYPEKNVSVNVTFTYPEGTANNPICINGLTSVQIQSLAAGEERYFWGNELKGATLKIKASDTSIRIGKDTHNDENGTLSVTVAESGDVVFAVGNSSESARNLELTISYPTGSRMNPRIFNPNANATRTVTTVDPYYCQYTATADSKFTLELVSGTPSWTYTITNLTTGETSGVHKSTDEPVVMTSVIGAKAGDKIQIVVSSEDDQQSAIKFKFKRNEKDASAVSEVALQTGDNALTPVSTANTTVYAFAPGKIGTYVFETDSGTLSYWGSSVDGMANATAEESASLVLTTTAEDETILIGITGADKCRLTVTEKVVYGEDKTVAVFSLALLENQKLVPVDLSGAYALQYNAETGWYCFGEENTLVLVDLSSDAFVNLMKFATTGELYSKTSDNLMESYNALLLKYAASAQKIAASETETRTLYPLTEDLMYILKNAGKTLGWYDAGSGNYLFGSVANPQADSLWMFSCCVVQTEEAPVEEAIEEIPEDPVVTE